MIVIDASALTAFILKEPGWKSLTTYIANSISVDHIIKEAMNAIWKAQVRGVISRGNAVMLHDILISLIGKNIIIEPEEKYISKAFMMAVDNGITVYDALYITLAMNKGLPLLTLDNKQGEAAKRLGVNVIIPHDIT